MPNKYGNLQWNQIELVSEREKTDFWFCILPQKYFCFRFNFRKTFLRHMPWRTKEAEKKNGKSTTPFFKNIQHTSPSIFCRLIDCNLSRFLCTTVSWPLFSLFGMSIKICDMIKQIEFRNRCYHNLAFASKLTDPLICMCVIRNGKECLIRLKLIWLGNLEELYFSLNVN